MLEMSGKLQALVSQESPIYNRPGWFPLLPSLQPSPHINLCSPTRLSSSFTPVSSHSSSHTTASLRPSVFLPPFQVLLNSQLFSSTHPNFSRFSSSFLLSSIFHAPALQLSPHKYPQPGSPPPLISLFFTHLPLSLLRYPNVPVVFLSPLSSIHASFPLSPSVSSL